MLLCVLPDLLTNVPAPAPFHAEHALEIAELIELLNPLYDTTWVGIGLNPPADKIA